MEQLDAITYLDGKWIKGNPPIIGPLSHASWLGSPVFDGARAFGGMAPDLDRHCARLIESAKAMLMTPPISEAELVEISLEGLRQFGPEEELYIRPLVWAEDSMGLLRCDPASAKFCVTVVQMPMPEDTGFTACLSRFRRPDPITAPTDAKAACLYPNGARAMQEAYDRGYENAVIMDLEGNVSEFASANLFAVIDDELVTPIPNGTFLNGVTRQRVLQILREDGFDVSERSLPAAELDEASEIFNTGNFGKLMWVLRYEERDFQAGPIYRRARELYWEFAATCRY